MTDAVRRMWKTFTWPSVYEQVNAALEDSGEVIEAFHTALSMFVNAYDVDGRKELHDPNCLYRKTWAMADEGEPMEDEPQCIAARAAFDRLHRMRVRMDEAER